MSSLKSRKRTERITNALCFIALIFLTCLCMLPIWWIFRSSLMSNAELFKWPPAFFPPRWLFSNYANTLEYFKFWTYLKNTMIIIVPSVIFGTITATMCGYAFAPQKPPCDEPTNVAIFTASGPGVDSETAIKLKNSDSVSQPLDRTVSRTREIMP